MKDPTQFSLFNKNTLQHAKDFLKTYEELFKWTPPENILEIGCAAGNITKEALYPFVEKHLNQLKATDISEEAIEYAKINNVNKKISFEVLDVTNEEQCSKYNEKFGHIFGFYCFQLIPETDLWSNNISKMLKPGGQFFAYMIVNKCFYNEILIEQRNEQDKPWWKYINDKPNQFVDYGSKPTDFIADVLHKAGLETIKINCERKYSTFSNIETIKGTIGTINPYSNFIPESMRNDYMEDYLNKAMKYVQVDSDGNYYFFLDVLSVLAKKV